MELYRKYYSLTVPRLCMAKCDVCGWAGKLAECYLVDVGSWESGIYKTPVCPECMGRSVLSEVEHYMNDRFTVLPAGEMTKKARRRLWGNRWPGMKPHIFDKLIEYLPHVLDDAAPGRVDTKSVGY